MESTVQQVNVEPQEVKAAEAASAESRELGLMLQLLRGCFKHNPWLYYLDLGLTLLGGYGSVALYLATPWSQPFLAAFFCLSSAVFLYRLGVFIHEIIHMPKGQMKAFKALWNIFAGIPLVSPHYLYRNHLFHHGVKTYATKEDGEYLPLGRQSGWASLWALLRSPLALILAPYRFLLLVPVTLLIPGGRKWLLKNASAFPMIPLFRYAKLPEVEPWWVFVDILASAGMWTVTLLIWTGTVPFEYALKIQSLVVLGLFLNGFRNLIAHTYRADGKAMGHLGQFEDSYNLEAPWLFEVLFMPVGLKYHALHHLFPTIPYHNLDKAHRLLMAGLPKDSSYRRNGSVKVATAFRWLFFPEAVQGENRSLVPGLLRRTAAAAVLVLSLAGTLQADPLVDAQPVDASFRTQGNLHRFDGSFTVDAPPKAVWAVLTDYDHISGFVANLSAKTKLRRGNQVLVEQVLGDGILFIRFEVKAFLEVQEDPLRSIKIRDVSHEHFERYHTAWSLEPDPSGQGTKVTCWMEAQKGRRTPAFLTGTVLKSGMTNFLKQYRLEIVRRGAKDGKQAVVAVGPKFDLPLTEP